PEYLNLQILPFSIQTLIENAIKHNTISLRNPLTIEIICDNTEYIIVKNQKNPKKEIEQTNGLGLKNLNDRYKYKTQQEIEIANSADIFSVKIPIIK
ncbi:MAG: histidine kinase, partial [Paludibacteraceae bacterium]|nr:histidine kinase [Paludibacteraceae bacterium]